MLGVTGAVLLVLSGAAAGDASASSLVLKEHQLAQLINILEKTEIYLSSELLGTNEIFDRLASLGNDYSSYFGAPDPVSLLRSSSLEMSSDLADYLESFGHTDLSGQLAQNTLFLNEVRDRHASAAERRDKLCRLRRVIGLCAGIMAGILFV